MSRSPVVLTVGVDLEAKSVGPVTQTDIVRFAGAGGDFNPLHHDMDYARSAGLSGVISMGQMQAGVLAAWVADTVHVEHLLSFSVRFASPLAIGEVLDLTGSVDEVDGSRGIAVLSVQACAGDRVVVHGRAAVRVSTQ